MNLAFSFSLFGCVIVLILYAIGNWNRIYRFANSVMLNGDLKAPNNFNNELTIKLYDSVLENCSDAILITDASNCIVGVNKAFLRMTGYESHEVVGMNPNMFSSGHTDMRTYDELWRQLHSAGRWKGELWDRRKDGSIYQIMASIVEIRDGNNAPVLRVANYRDTTERMEAEVHLASLAMRDHLTGLFNRMGLHDILKTRTDRSGNSFVQMALLLIDLDHFKQVNDSLGHSAGDELLREVAVRICAEVRDGDFVARLGGDEYAVALPGIVDVDVLKRISRQLITRIGQTYALRGHELHISASVGVAVLESDECNLEGLIMRADMAMYSAKAYGRNNVQFYTESLNIHASERLKLDHDLHVALENSQFELYYQPKLSMANCDDSHMISSAPKNFEIIGFEALIRWRHPIEGYISPSRFIPISEESGLILQIGNWVINEACQQLRHWRLLGFDSITIAINLSAYQLRDTGLVAYIARCLSDCDLKGGDIELEITESVVMNDPEANIETMRALRAMGIRLSIDDFGTGYSSLSYLKRLPIHSLKLDKSFVNDIENDHNDVAICKATIALAHSLKLFVVAEGVETEAQLNFLQQLRCDALQGFYFSKPLKALDAQLFLARHLEGIRGSRKSMFTP